jgi:hypothetical protein
MNKELKDELIELAPVLSKLPKKELEVPEGYFDSFSSKMMARIKYKNIEPNTIAIPLKKWSNFLAAAIVFVVMGISIYIFKIQTQNTDESITIDEYYLTEIDESVLMEFTTNTANEETQTEEELYQQYLDEHTIIEEL